MSNSNSNSSSEIAKVLTLLNTASTPQYERALLLQELERFQASLESWRTCCSKLLSERTDLETAFFLLNTLDKLVASPTKWGVVTNEGKTQIKECLVKLSRQSVQVLLRRKACQVLVLVGKRECSTVWLDFAEFVRLECEQGRLDLILASCELFGSDRHFAISKYRAAELKQYVQEVAAPNFVAALTPVMNLNETAIRATAALIEWIPLEQVTLDFVSALLAASEKPAISAIAFGALAQLLDRNYYPPNAERFIESIAHRAFDSLAKTPKERFEQDSTLTHATLEFISRFTKRHLSKAEKYFSIPQFLQVFYVFTFQLKDLRLFLVALEVWDGFIEHCIEFETRSGGIASPYGAPVLGPLLWNLLERFLFSKNNSSASFLEQLERSEELIEQQQIEDEEENNEMQTATTSSSSNHDESSREERQLMVEDCDLSYLVARVVRLVQRTALLPVSSLACLSQMLTSVFQGLSASNAAEAILSTRSARDVSVFLRVITASAPLLARPECARLPEVASFAKTALGLARTSLSRSCEGGGAAFVVLCSQAMACCASLVPWAQLTEAMDFLQGCTELGMESLETGPIAATIQLRAIYLISALPAVYWLELIARKGLAEVCQYVRSDHTRARMYRAFALTAYAIPEAFRLGLAPDVNILMVGSAEDARIVRRSLQGLGAVVDATSTKPETIFKKLVFATVGAAGLAKSARLVDSPEHQTVTVALDFLASAFANLRRQIGDEDCAMIVRRCLDCAPRMDVRSQTRVLGLLLSVIEETTRAFDALIPSILDLVLTVGGGEPSEFDDICVRIVRMVLVSHWRWFFQADNVFQASFVRVCGALVQRLDLRFPPDVVRVVCRALLEANETHFLFRNDVFKSAGLFIQTCGRTLVLIASRERELILDELMQLLYILASADPAHFYETALPSAMEAFPHKQVTMKPFSNVVVRRDQGAFEEAVAMFCESAT